MSAWLIVALVLLGASWQFCQPWAYPQASVWWPLVGLAGLAMLAAVQHVTAFEASRRRVLGVLAALLVAAILLPWPYALGPGLMTLGAAAALLPMGRSRSRLTLALFGLGGVHLLQSGTLALFHFLGPALNDTTLLAGLTHGTLKVLGVEVFLHESELLLPGVDPPLLLAPTWSNAAAVHVSLALVAVLWARASAGATRGLLVVSAAAVLGMGLVRFVAMLLVAKSLATYEVLWVPTWTAISMIPVYLAGAFGRPRRPWWTPIRDQLHASSIASPGWRLLAAGAGATLLVVAIGYEDPGRRHSKGILIDEYHSDWEWTERPFDTEWFGEKSTYNYYCLAEFLAQHYPLERGHEAFTPELLERFGTIVLKVPTQAYQQQEVEALVSFVERGGGLVLIGDHTNVFGSSEFLNQVATRFDFRFVEDVTYDLLTGGLSLWDKPRLLPHPVVQNMPTMLFGSSCSLRAAPTLGAAMVGYRLRTLPADYSQRSFFPEKRLHQNGRSGAFNQALAVKSGKGRVAAFTDSTIFSNFFIFMPGKPELALGLVEWAHRANRWSWFNPIAGLFGLALVAAALLSRARLLAPLAAATLSGALAIELVDSLNRSSYPLPEPLTLYVKIAFEGEHSDFFIPELRLTQTGDKDFDAFYVWMQRLGFVPRKEPTLERALVGSRAVVLVDPKLPFSADELAATEAFVRRGAGLLVLADRDNESSTAGQLLAHFGLELSWPPAVAYPELSRDQQWVFEGAGSVQGATPLVTAPDGRVVLGFRTIGRGRIVACSNSRMFERSRFGMVNHVPNAWQSTLTRLHFSLIRFLVDPEHEFELKWAD